MSIRLDAVLHAVELPAGVAHLDSGLADVDADAFSHDEDWSYRYWEERGQENLTRSTRRSDKLLIVRRTLIYYLNDKVYINVMFWFGNNNNNNRWRHSTIKWKLIVWFAYNFLLDINRLAFINTLYNKPRTFISISNWKRWQNNHSFFL